MDSLSWMSGFDGSTVRQTYYEWWVVGSFFTSDSLCWAIRLQGSGTLPVQPLCLQIGAERAVALLQQDGLRCHFLFQIRHFSEQGSWTIARSGMTFPTSPPPPPFPPTLLAPSLLSVLSYVYLCMWFTFAIVLEGCRQHWLSDSTRLSPQFFLLHSDSLTVQYLLHQRQVLPETKIYCRFKVSLCKHFSGPAPSNDTHAAFNKSTVL